MRWLFRTCGTKGIMVVNIVKGGHKCENGMGDTVLCSNMSAIRTDSRPRTIWRTRGGAPLMVQTHKMGGSGIRNERMCEPKCGFLFCKHLAILTPLGYSAACIAYITHLGIVWYVLWWLCDATLRGVLDFGEFVKYLPCLA